jgi:hypothetical protein
MGALGSKLRKVEGGTVLFQCPGCKESHAVHVEPAADGRARPVWGFNGNGDAPTFTPSVLVRTGHHVPDFADRFQQRGTEPSCWCTYNAEHPNEPAPFQCTVCHSFVTDGRIHFLADCTHALAGHIVDLPDWDTTC